MEITTEQKFSSLVKDIHACDICSYHLQLPPKPVIQVHQDARIVIIAQAPGMRSRTSGKPFDDASGDRLRSWLGVDRATFYDETKFALMAMGFCYPGKTKTGDLPPCKECAPLWHPKIWSFLKDVRLTLMVGAYAQAYYLKSKSITQTVQNWRQFLPDLLPMPHPSWHNNAWLTHNPWFLSELVPTLKDLVHKSLTYR